MDSRDLTKDDYEFVDRLISELDEKLSMMPYEERKKYFFKMGFHFIDDDSSEKKQQIMRLKLVLQAVLEQKKQSIPRIKTGMEEMIEELGLQGCLIFDSEGEMYKISDGHLRMLGVQIDEDVRRCEQAEQESVAQLIKGPKL